MEFDYTRHHFSMKIFLLAIILIPYFLFAQEDFVLIRKNFIGSDKIEKEYSVLRSDTNLLHGLYKAYHYNGKLFLKGRYAYGKRDGEWVSYHENGKMETHNYYCNGQYCGIWDYYTNEGIKEYSFNMGKMDTTGQFINGLYLMSSIQKVIKYPEKARENDIQGMVDVLVLEDSACHLVVQLAKGFDYDCDAEALRAVRKVVGIRGTAPCKNEQFIILINFNLGSR